jgi:hypothetical protein
VPNAPNLPILSPIGPGFEGARLRQQSPKVHRELPPLTVSFYSRRTRDGP